MQIEHAGMQWGFRVIPPTALHPQISPPLKSVLIKKKKDKNNSFNLTTRCFDFNTVCFQKGAFAYISVCMCETGWWVRGLKVKLPNWCITCEEEDCGAAMLLIWMRVMSCLPESTLCKQTTTLFTLDGWRHVYCQPGRRHLRGWSMAWKYQ